MNYFDILDANEFNTQDEIKEKYRKTLLEHHPDKLSNGTSSITVDDIKKAYNVLSNSKLKLEYIESLKLNTNLSISNEDEIGLDQFKSVYVEEKDLFEFYLDCQRCKNVDSFYLDEEILEANEEHNHVFVNCEMCSQWLKVVFSPN
ncbi:hypothetical protein DAHU10_012430 [Hanseniaspora uvarum]|nr:hypothetical protein DAHU10_012430 [Hanseniaspora uvarum]